MAYYGYVAMHYLVALFAYGMVCLNYQPQTSTHSLLLSLFFRDGHVYGRAVVDARVCASPGRDRENDEAKSTSPTPTMAEGGARKRPALSQNLEVNMPSKMRCISGRKTKHVIEVCHFDK